MSSGHSGSSSSQMKHVSNGRRSSFAPPPPPPPPHALMMMQHRESSLRLSFIPPPPPPRSGSGFVDLHQDATTRLSRTGSFRGSLYDDDEDDRRSEVSRASFSQSRQRLSGVDRDKQGMQDSLAAILSGRKPTTVTRRDSIDSTFSVVSVSKERKKKKDVNGTNSRTAATASPVAEPTITNAFAASLAAIRRNRADTMDETSNGSSESPVPVVRESRNVRSRKRETQLSAEGKELLKKAMAGGDSPVTKSKPKANGRKGLFDDSSSESDDSDAGLFATGKGRGSVAATKHVEANGKPKRHSSTTPTSSHSSVGVQRAGARGFDDGDDDGDDDSDATDMSRSGNGALLLPLLSLLLIRVSTNHCVRLYSSCRNLDVCEEQNVQSKQHCVHRLWQPDPAAVESIRGARVVRRSERRQEASWILHFRLPSGRT